MFCNTKIKTIQAREILDSRGNPTVQVEISDGKRIAIASVPSGASTGIHEALELRDGDANRYMGKGVLKAIKNVNEIIAPVVIGQNPKKQGKIDQIMLDLDGTENKSKLGANAILGVSLAVAKLAALQKNVELYEHLGELYGNKEFTLPRPMMNIINGGEHADNGLAIQEFMVFPKLADFSQNLRAGTEIFHHLKKILAKAKMATSVGDEGGFAPNFQTTKEALDAVIESISAAGYAVGTDIEIALDAAASEFYKNGSYTVDGKSFDAEKLVAFYQELVEHYPISSIEDSHSEDDFHGFQKMVEVCGDKVQIVGDDLFVTNRKRLSTGISEKQANAILIKVNQIGSLTETFDAISLAQKNNFGVIISHRSGETGDTFIADLAVATNAGQIKTGSLSRSERVEKYNRLIQISEKLNA